MIEHKRVNLKLKSLSIRSRYHLISYSVLPNINPGMTRALQCSADEQNGSNPCRMKMQAFSILSERIGETLLAAVRHFLFCLVGKEKPGERSCQFVFSFIKKVISV